MFSSEQLGFNCIGNNFRNDLSFVDYITANNSIHEMNILDQNNRHFIINKIISLITLFRAHLSLIIGYFEHTTF